jgi:predicted aconitase with swiveling domain
VTEIRGRVLAPGTAIGAAQVLSEPLSLWGGLDTATGRVVDAHHPQLGTLVAGRILVMPGGRGSSSSSSVLAEAVRLGTAPLAILLCEEDLILAIGAAVAAELYAREVPIVELAEADLRRIPDGGTLAIEPDGRVLTASEGDR